MNVNNGEDNLEKLRGTYYQKLKYLVVLNGKSSDKEALQEALNDCHTHAVEYFNYFERTVDEYRSEGITVDTVKRKPEDAINIIKPICNHWTVLSKLAQEKGLIFPQPDYTAYASIQRVLKSFYPKRKNEFRKEFFKAGLPTYGFDQKDKHSKWKPKRNYENYIISFILIMASLIFIFAFRPSTALQNNAMRLALSFSFTFAAVFLLKGSVLTKISIGQTFTISAAGGIGVFLFLYIYEPAEHKDIPPIPAGKQSEIINDTADTNKFPNDTIDSRKK